MTISNTRELGEEDLARKILYLLEQRSDKGSESLLPVRSRPLIVVPGLLVTNQNGRWPIFGSESDGGQGIEFNQHWYCCPDCFEQAARVELCRMYPVGTGRRPRQHRIPLGLLLLSRGLIDNQKLQEALGAQRESRKGRLGEWLMQLGAVSEDQVTAALATQWNCPVFPLERHPRFIDCAGMVPLPILEAARMAIVHYLPVRNSLYVAFADGIDHCALQALEEMFRCRTEPCIARASSLQHALEAIRSLPRPPEVVIDNIREPQEMAGAVRRYVAATTADRVRIVKFDAYIWAHLENSSQPTNVLFRIADGDESY